MAEQGYRNHARFDPAYHFTLAPMALFVLIGTICRWWQAHTFARGLAVVAAIAFLQLVFLARTYALKAQDRVIRLEERLRIASLGGGTAATTRQLIALRFASDAEVAALAERAVREQMTPKQIKAAVQTWRADHERI